MKKNILVFDSKPRDVVIELGKALQTPVDVKKNEFVVVLPQEFGEGYVRALEFGNGIGVVEANYVLVDEFEFALQKGIVHPLKITFNLGSSYYRKLEKDLEESVIKTSKAEMVCSTPTNNHHYRIPPNEKIHIFSIEINRKAFESKLELFYDEIEPEIEELFRDLNGIIAFKHSGVLTYELSESVNQFLNTELEGALKYVFQEGKVYEMISLFLKQYIDDQRDDGERRLFRVDNYHQIEKATKFIKDNLGESFNAPSIAREVGLNVSQLQAGFRSVHNVSVNEFKIQAQLERAQQLIFESRLNVSQICVEIGITSRSYFSKIFKDKFGVSPKEYILSYRNNENYKSS